MISAQWLPLGEGLKKSENSLSSIYLKNQKAEKKKLGDCKTYYSERERERVKGVGSSYGDWWDREPVVSRAAN